MKSFIDTLADSICAQCPADPVRAALDVVAEVNRRNHNRAAQVTELVCRHLHVLEAELFTADRGPQHVADARAICWAILRSELHMSYPEIGNMFNRDHSTVMARVKCAHRSEELRSHVTALATTVRRRWSSQHVEAAE
jgi:chromosomal replication initiation ATPase DnaA